MKHKPYYDYLRSLSSGITLSRDDMDEQFCRLMTLGEGPDEIRALLIIFKNTFS